MEEEKIMENTNDNVTIETEENTVVKNDTSEMEQTTDLSLAERFASFGLKNEKEKKQENKSTKGDEGCMGGCLNRLGKFIIGVIIFAIFFLPYSRIENNERVMLVNPITKVAIGASYDIEIDYYREIENITVNATYSGVATFVRGNEFAGYTLGNISGGVTVSTSKRDVTNQLSHIGYFDLLFRLLSGGNLN